MTTMRDDLRQAASDFDRLVNTGQSPRGREEAQRLSAALRALADRLDMALSGRGGPVLAAMRRLDANPYQPRDAK